ncbi:hypothetical protein [Flavivirga aquatica]
MKIIFLSFSLFLITGISFGQKGKEPKSIITRGNSIKKYHNKEDLERMKKGQLLVLYNERIETLIRTLPYIAFATKPGVTMVTLGIPNTDDNVKALDNQFEATDSFIETNMEFQGRLLPYSDKSDLMAAILFYEEIMKSLHEYSEYH